jgi:O-Antigen ligase
MAVRQERRVWPPSRPLLRFPRIEAWISLVVGTIVFLLAYDQGGFSLSSRAVTAIVTWWAIVLGIALAIWPRARVSRAAAITGTFFAAFALWTFASIFWADSAENAFIEFNRAAMYLGIFLVGVLAGSRANLHRWADGFAIGVVAGAGVSLISRLFPSTFSLQGFPVFLPGVLTRLSFPIGYWNGLGTFVAFGFPLCLGIAVRASVWWVRALAVAALPWLAAVIYLTSSRGGVAAAVVGTAVLIGTTMRRWTAVGAAFVAAVGSAAAIAVLIPRGELVNGPIGSDTAAAQGHSAFVLILLVCIATGATFAAGHRVLRNVRPPRLVGPVAVAAVAVGILVVVLLAHPADRFAAFKQLPGGDQQQGFVSAHLLSGSGSGRWQFWTAAVDEWKSALVVGRGAGSYQAWWAQHASFPYYVRNAHSLYLETLGDLGLVGLIMLLGAFGYGGFVAAKTALRLDGNERVAAASLYGVLAAFYVAAAIEWVWQLSVVSGLGVLSLGLLAHPVTQPALAAARPRRARASQFALGVVLLGVAWAVICAQALPWLTERELNASAAAATRGDGPAAMRHALDARGLEPWASSPHLQLALVQEQRSELRAAEGSIQKAIERNPADWRLWLVAARIETKLGEIPRARRSLVRAKALNPLSPLFSGI